jgi:hypothetical protein
MNQIKQLLRVGIICIAGWGAMAAQAAVDVKTQVFASVLPEIAVMQPGETVSWFATMINSSDTPITNCKPFLQLPTAGFTDFEFFPGISPGQFFFQTTDPATNALTGTKNQAFDIPAGGSQTMALFANPNLANTVGFPFSTTTENLRMPLFYGCDEGRVAVSKINQPRLSVNDDVLPWILPVISTLSGDGIANFNDSQTTAIAIAAIAVNGDEGPFPNIVVTPNGLLRRAYDRFDEFHMIDAYPGQLKAEICQTDQLGACLAPPAQFVEVTFASDALTFSAFYTIASNSRFLELPSLNRANIDFGVVGTDTATPRRFGSASVALYGSAAPLAGLDLAWRQPGETFVDVFDGISYQGDWSCEPGLSGNEGTCRGELAFYQSAPDKLEVFFDQRTLGCDSTTCENSDFAGFAVLDCNLADTESFVPVGTAWAEPNAETTCSLNNTKFSKFGDGVSCIVDGEITLKADEFGSFDLATAPIWPDIATQCGIPEGDVGGDKVVKVERHSREKPVVLPKDLTLVELNNLVGNYSLLVLDGKTDKTLREVHFRIRNSGGDLVFELLRSNGEVSGFGAMEDKGTTLSTANPNGGPFATFAFLLSDNDFDQRHLFRFDFANISQSSDGASVSFFGDGEFKASFSMVLGGDGNKRPKLSMNRVDDQGNVIESAGNFVVTKIP